jgi:hypothetical protein
VTWDGHGRHVTLTWPGRRLERISVDPDGVLLLETRRSNNTAYVPGAGAARPLDDVASDLAEAIALGVLAGVGP